ncbi:acyl carrier protein [bacterium]|nr:acyl carrier protein [bacterium]
MVNREDVQKGVIKIASQVLKIDPSEIKPESNFVFDLGAESIDSVELVAGFETEFDIEMDEEAALEVQTVDKAVDYIIGYLEKK